MVALPQAAEASCGSPANAIEAENCAAGTPQSVWDVSGEGDPSIQGFATDISVNRGTTVKFKVDTTASAYRLDIFRMGFYQGNGARLVAAISPSVSLPQTQPPCLTNSTGLIDCGNWAVSASWTVPATATSGVYFARAVRTDTGGASHIFFVVRDDSSHSEILFQTADTTWQAYNDYGGNSLYIGNGSVGRAYKVSYNRPFRTRVAESESWVFNGEYPMIRWLEGNGYDVTYHTGVDADRSGSLIRNHKLWMSNGHDEYWSGAQRASVEAARDAGVHLAFFSGNKIFWKTRWESSIDGTGTPYRTLVCYKETHANDAIDPSDPPTWTGTWRDPRFSPPADGGRPENALAGTIFMINGPYDDTYTVTQADGRMRFWRNTSIASLGTGQEATLAPGTLGAEVDVDLDNGYRPPGLFGVSTNHITTGSLYLLDHGSSYGPGNTVQRITLYRHTSGALVFATGSYQWSWGLDAHHDRTNLGSTTDIRMQQATVNLFADMGVQPATMMAGLAIAVASTDTVPPASQITSPAAAATVTGGATVVITGTAADAGGGVVGGVEVSTDGGATWHPTSGMEGWSYAWTVPGSGTWTLRSRAVDDSGNIESPSSGRTVTVAGSGPACTSNCTIWPSNTTPGLVDGGPDSAVELGVKFRSDLAGQVTGVRFYKAAGNSGTHVASLWTSTGTKLATATFAGESASGWQQVSFPAPVTIAANTVYVASYFCPAGHYSADVGFFTGKGADNAPLHALADGTSGGDGVYAYGSTSTFPTSTWFAANYWVDVVFTPTPTAGLTSIVVTPAVMTVLAGATQQFTATGTYSDGSTQVLGSGVAWESSDSSVATIGAAGLATAVAPGSTTVSATSGAVSGSTAFVVQPTALAITNTSLPGATQYQVYAATLAGSGGTLPYIWSVSGGALPAGLTLDSSNGVITGTPTDVGAATVSIQLRDSAAQRAVGTFSITITAAPALAISTASLVNGTQYVAYAATLAATGGKPPYTWSTATGLPAGLALNTATGVISGTPSGSGTSSFTAQVTDAVAQTATKALSITVAAAPALTVSTTTLAGGTPGVAYAATLAATGGLTPYTWSIASGLPTGLTLNTSTGAISGTPTTAGTYPFTAQVTDAVSGVATKALGIVVTAAADVTIWPASTVPGLVDGGADSSVELGVKFRSDVSGYVKGIRFYKASTNTGAHVANLWSSTGTKLATATFSGETASGWQQVLFATPVAVTANTVYVASYHANSGHYSADVNYFATKGADNAPLHALANGVSGGNGVYAYGSASAFPSSTWSSANYWVDVVFSATPPVTLASIVVTPASATIPVGATQQFTATGTYSDGTTQALTTGVTWASSRTATATVGTSGLASAVTVGTATISATVGTVTGSASLTVQAAPLSVATTTLAGGTQFVAYTATLAATGGTAPYAWSIATGLPAGLALNATTGVISGTPTGSGTSSFTVQVTDAALQTATRALSITVAAAPALAVSTATLVGGTQFVAYTATLAATGGLPPYTWSIPAGLPPGLALNTTTGVISGTPSGSGAYAFTAQVTDAAAQTATRAFSITITAAPALAISTASLVNGTQYVAYAATLAATGGKPPYTWSTATGLPAGLALNTATGVISGTPSGSGTSSFTAQVTDAVAQTATKALSITVAAAPALTVSTTTLAGGTPGVAYAATLAATGGLTPYTWSIASGLPTGLTLNTSTGAISGTPTTAGTYPFTAQVTDAVSGVATKALGIVVTAAADVTIWPASTVPGLVDGGADSSVELGVKFRSDVSGYVKGIRFYKASTNTGAHVANLWSSTGTKLATATFSGETASGWQQVLFATPVAVTANTVYVASYHANSGHYSADVNYFATKGADNAPLHALANGVSGGNGVYAYGSASAFPSSTWSSANYWVDVVFSATPPVTLASIVVTPASATIPVGATQQFTATGTYSDGTTQALTTGVTWASSRTATATVGTSGLASAVTVGTATISATVGTVTGSASLTVQAAPLSVATTTLAGGTQFVAYTATLAATGGTAPYAWSIATGLPAGLALNATTGVISGTPTGSGTSSFTVQVTDAALQTATRALSITVAAAPALAVSTATLVGGTQFVAYTATLAATGGLPPYTWSIPAGLPPGLALNTTTGVISGTPSGSGAYAFTAQVTDAAAQTATRAFSITVVAAPSLAISTTALAGATVGAAYSETLVATGGIAPYTWSIPAGMPPGLTIGTTTGVISGTATIVGAFTFTAQVTDAAAGTATGNLTINVLPPGNYTLWPSGTVPGVADAGADGSVELGVKFRADQGGTITGIRFYKSAANTGTHVGSLWSSSGTRLAFATFTNETAFGWQQVNFTTPVTITANTVYVASYHANGGHYAADDSYFATSGWDNLPLHALANGVSGGNGVYAYGSSAVFPSQTYLSSNYWVDVVFNPSGQVASLGSISVTPASATLAIGAVQQLTATASYSDGTRQDVTREAVWTSSSPVIAPVSGGGLVTALASGYSSVSATLGGVAGSASVSVGTPPPPANEGPGGPILIVSGSENPISRYLAEILRAEGLLAFTATDLSFVTSSTLASHDLVLLGDVPLTAAQAAMIGDWVRGGGNLVAMHPDKQLAGLLGLRDAGGTLSEGYLLVDTTASPGTGIVGQTIQFHGTADLYDLNGARAIATLYSTANASAGRPAVTLATAGAGQAAAFTYDLARSVVNTRQGNPLWSGQARTGQVPTRADDLFYGAATFDPQPDWIDLNKVAIPQADEQQRLLANLIVQMNLGKKPLPHFWYLPAGFKAAVVMTGDDHNGGGTAGRFDDYVAASPAGCSVADWQCIRGTSYVYDNSPLDPLDAVSFTAVGFEVALHTSTSCANFTSYADLDSYYAPQLSSFAAAYPGVPSPVTNRTHCIAWSDYDTQPQVSLAHGMRFDSNYYFYPPEWVNDRPGFFTGSGMPMRYALRTGQTVDVYQAVTQMTDESGQTYPMTINALLDNAVGPLGYYGVFTANMHTDAVESSGSSAIVASAKARGVPVVSAKQMLTWLDGRNGSSFGSLSWNGSVLSFNVTAASGARNLQAMVPAQVGTLRAVAVTRGGAPISFASQTVKGVPYVVFPAVSAAYQVTYQ